MKKFLSLALSLSLVASLLVGCSSSTTSSTTTSTTTDAATTATESADDTKTIGMVVKYTSSEYIQAFLIGAQETCDELGIELLTVDAQGDSLKIMDAIDNFMVQGIDGFILGGAVDLTTLVPGIERLNEAGIPVFALDTCPEGGHVDMFITFDIVDSSRKAAEQMIEGIKEANSGEVPEGVILEVTGAVVDMFTDECHAGFISVIEQYPQLTVVQGDGNWNNEDSYARTSDMLTANGDSVVGIYVHTPDIMGAGVVAAVESAGKDPSDYFISGICIGMEGISLLEQDKLYAVVEQPALDSAVLAVQYLNDMLNGEEIPAIGDIVEEEGALWSPAYVIENEYADSGATMILQGPLIPMECDPSNDLLWENRIG